MCNYVRVANKALYIETKTIMNQAFFKKYFG